MVTANRQSPVLRGASILIVDDEFLIALNMEMLLIGAGARVCIATTLHKALDIALSESFRAALLDIRLGRQTSEPIANVLARRGIPFLFFSAHALPDDMRWKFPNATTLPKPLGFQSLLTATEELVRSRAA